MLTNRALLFAGWMVAITIFPALQVASPVVKPIIDRVPERPIVLPNKPHNPPVPNGPIKADVAKAKAYNDGRVYYGAVSSQPVVYQRPYRYGPFAGNGWWRGGPVRRAFSAPFRWLFRRRC